MDIQGIAQQIMQWCDILGKISQDPDCLDRRYLSLQHKQANQQVKEWMQAADMKCWQDEVGNIWGRYESQNKNAARLIMGSHLDTVPNGGKYDGMLGVLLPVALLTNLHKHQQSFPFHIDIVGFCDEEGTRFGTTLLGSRALTGNWQEEWRDLSDINGITLAEAMKEFSLDFDKVKRSCIAQNDNLLGYLETHIEQGPILEALNAPVGVVTAINGARRLLIDVSGCAGHAGTVPMNLRQDALAASAEMILAVEKLAKRHKLVATVGYISNHPNGVNVISGAVQFSIDIRSENDTQRDACLQEILQAFDNISMQRGLSYSISETHNASSVSCDKTMQDQLGKAISNADLPLVSLSSGAGHDAMEMAEICPVAMLFVRCEKGISHHPKEAITQEDVADALKVLNNYLQIVASEQ